jgi:hypothetical protein
MREPEAKQMKQRTAPGTAGRHRGPGPAIVVLGGSFAPVHAGHLAALEAGKRAAENAGFTVVGGYLVCAPQFHVSAKLRGRGQEAVADEVMGVEARLHMCNAVAADSDWLLPTSRPHYSAKQCGKEMVALRHEPQTQVVVIKGRDLPALTKTGNQTLSSSLIRGDIDASGVAAVRRFAKSGALPRAAAAELERLLTRWSGSAANPSVRLEPESEPEPGPELEPEPEPERRDRAEQPKLEREREREREPEPEPEQPELAAVRDAQQALAMRCQQLYRSEAVAADHGHARASVRQELAATAAALLRHNPHQPVALLSVALLNAREGRDADATATLRHGLSILRSRGREDGPIGVEMRRQLTDLVNGAVATQQDPQSLPRTLSARERQARMLADAETAAAEADSATASAELAAVTAQTQQLRFQCALLDMGFQCAGNT